MKIGKMLEKVGGEIGNAILGKTDRKTGEVDEEFVQVLLGD